MSFRPGLRFRLQEMKTNHQRGKGAVCTRERFHWGNRSCCVSTITRSPWGQDLRSLKVPQKAAGKTKQGKILREEKGEETGSKEGEKKGKLWKNMAGVEVGTDAIGYSLCIVVSWILSAVMLLSGRSAWNQLDSFSFLHVHVAPRMSGQKVITPGLHASSDPLWWAAQAQRDPLWRRAFDASVCDPSPPRGSMSRRHRTRNPVCGHLTLWAKAHLLLLGSRVALYLGFNGLNQTDFALESCWILS